MAARPCPYLELGLTKRHCPNFFIFIFFLFFFENIYTQLRPKNHEQVAINIRKKTYPSPRFREPYSDYLPSSTSAWPPVDVLDVIC